MYEQNKLKNQIINPKNGQRISGQDKSVVDNKIEK